MNETIHIGDRFGHLTVIDKDKRPRHNASWLCRCDCGKEIYSYTSRLINGKHRSCGCTDHTKRNSMADLTGRQIGHLTVVARSSNPKSKNLWLCTCDCGEELQVCASALLSGKYTSCGKCKYRHLRTKEAMIGKRFSHLTVERIVEAEPGLFKLLCLCDCGKYTLADTAELTYGYKRSCGCNLKKRPRTKPMHHTLTNAQKLKTNDSIRYHKANSNTGIKGIHKRKRLAHNAYEVAITSQGQYHYIGHYPTLEAAKTARLTAEETYFVPLIRQLDSESDSGNERDS